MTLLFFRSAFFDMAHHKLLSMRAVVVGWVALIVISVSLAPPLARLDYWLYALGWADIRPYWSGDHAWVGHFLIVGVLNTMVGYVVGRLHPRYRAAMVLAFFLSLTLFFDMPRFVLAVIDVWGDWNRLARFLGTALADFVFLRLPILVGGIWSVRH